MLPTNVMSFMKKFTTQPDASATSVTPEDGGRPFSKLRQSVTDLMSATGNVTKLAPAKVTSVEDIQPKEETTTFEPPKKPVGSSSGREGGDRCRVCLKFFKPEDISKQCYGCQQKVCEDCASYSTTTDTEHDSVWRCSICRRKHAARGQPVVTQESTESLLGVPIPDSFQRRHSDARLNSQVGGQTNTTGSGLAPPRSPEQRRHSDVSPASLKELEKFRKVAGERREELRWERELEWRSKSRSGSPDRLQERGDRGRGTSPQRKGSIMPAPDLDPSGNIDDEDDRRLPRRGGTVRRKSKVTRQHSYDDEIKTAAMSSSGSLTSHPDPGLGPPVQLPRRASAYDVYAAPGGGGIAAMTNFAAQHRASISQQGGREPEDRQPSRRSSFRAVKPVMPYEMGSDDEKMINLDAAPVPEVPLTRRRASQLPDITSMRGLPPVPGTGKPPPAVVSRVSLEDRELPRQGSLADGEGIKIVIHDVDSEHLARPNPMRKVKLRRDSASEKVHRTGGFGMRVVGGKSGSDGHMYASIVWTVPGGPAEKAGLQRGDKVLEWSGVSLIDRRYEDVAQIIDHSSDIAEVIVEHTTDPSGDSLDDPGMVPPPGKAAGSLGLQLDSEADKTPTSPTRRKLPKTPV